MSIKVIMTIINTDYQSDEQSIRVGEFTFDGAGFDPEMAMQKMISAGTLHADFYRFWNPNQL